MNVISRLAIAVVLVAVPLHAQILERVLVKVNGDILTMTELEDRQAAAVRQSKPEAATSSDALKKALEEVTPQILVDVIDEMLLVQLGKEKGYRLSDDQFKSWLENLRKEQNLQDDQKFQAALKQEGMTMADLRKSVEKTFMVSQVQREEVGSKLQITEEEARQYYLAHKDEFIEPATVTLREILIEVPAAVKGGQAVLSVARDDEVAEQAAGVRARIMAGADFGKVASEVSTAGSKANGGLIGPLALSELSMTLQQMIEKMKPGEVTQPLRVARGFQILKLETIKVAAVPAFDNVRDLVADKVHDNRQQTEVRKFLTRMRGQAIIEWKSEELKQAYEKQLKALDTPSGHD